MLNDKTNEKFRQRFTKITHQKPVSITKEQWMSILKDKDIITEKDLQVLKLTYNVGCAATSPQLAQLLDMPHYAPLNRQVGELGKRIAEKLNIQAIEKRHGEGFDWWNVPFWGTSTKEGFYWILRPELEEAICGLCTLGESFLEEVSFPEEIDLQSYEHLYEGARKQIYVNSYERNRGARDQCVKHYEARCIICSFDFERTYGEIGKGVIHVHHLKPLSNISKEYQVDPINDLRPVCPNCHLIIHKKNPPYSIDEVIAMLKEAALEGR